MNVSFQPDGKWFIFIEATGNTVAKDFPTKNAAIIELHRLRLSHA